MEQDVISSSSHHRSHCWRERNQCFTYTMALRGLFKDSKYEPKNSFPVPSGESYFCRQWAQPSKEFQRLKGNSFSASSWYLFCGWAQMLCALPHPGSSQFMWTRRYFATSETTFPLQISKDLFWFDLASELTHRISSKNLQLWFAWFQKLGHHVKETFHKRFYALRMASH